MPPPASRIGFRHSLATAVLLFVLGVQAQVQAQQRTFEIVRFDLKTENDSTVGGFVETYIATAALRLYLRSTTGSPVQNVHWRIRSTALGFDSGDRTIGYLGTQGVIPFHVPWVPVTGSHTFVASVWLEGRPSRLSTAAATLSVTILVTERKLLRYADLLRPIADLFSMQLDDPKGQCTAVPLGFASDSMFWHVAWAAGASPPADLNCTLSVEVHKGVVLRNGWVVENAHLTWSQGGGMPYPVWDNKPSGSRIQGRFRVTLSNEFPRSRGWLKTAIKGPYGTEPAYGPDIRIH